MRVFYLTTELPWPPVSGGRVRSLAELELVASLEEVTEIRVLTLREDPVDRAVLDALSKRVPKAQILEPVFHPIHVKRFPAYLPWIALQRALRGRPYLAAKWVAPALKKRIAKELRASRADVVYIDHLGMGAYLGLVRRVLPKARVVLEQHNVESDFFRQFAERKQGIVKIVGMQEHRVARKFEARIMRQVDAVIAISDADAKDFSEMSGVRALVVPQVVKYTRFPWKSPTKPRAVYLGNLSWHPNAEGLDWFCREVWPKVRAEIPDAVVSIGGSGLKTDNAGKPIVPDTWRGEGIEVIGFVEKLEPFYEGASAFLAPILGGSGIRIKVLEAFRAGLPLVTTPAGALGLPIENEKEALIASDPTEFSRALMRLFRDADLQKRLHEAGYAYLDRAHSLAVAQGIMRRALGS